MNILGREARGLTEALRPFTEKETLTARELRLLTDLLLFKAGPGDAAEPALAPELDVFEDTAELWLFDRRSDAVLRYGWRITGEPAAEGEPLPADELSRSLALRAYLLACPKNALREELLAHCERRIKRLSRGRISRGRGAKGGCL